MADSEQTPRLRPAHVLASSLAAVTGAFLASRLGVYGTVIGVGVISLFSTIGTDIYVRSLDRTRQMAARSKARTIAPSRTGPVVENAELPRIAGSKPSRWTKTRILFVAAGAIASFALAFVVITGIESVSGSSLSGGGGTTLGELGGGGSTDRGPDTDEVDAPGQQAPTPEPDGPSPTPTDPPDSGDRDAYVPPTEQAPDVEQPSDPETPSPSPTEPPTSEPTEPPSDGGEN